MDVTENQIMVVDGYLVVIVMFTVHVKGRKRVGESRIKYTKCCIMRNGCGKLLREIQFGSGSSVEQAAILSESLGSTNLAEVVCEE